MACSALGEEESVSSSYLSLSGHDSGVTRQSSMSYASVDGTGTLSDISSGYLSADVNQDSEHDDSEYDESSNSENKCFSCFLDEIESLATHTCHTCRPEKKFLCHICLRQHNKFCDGHDVISLSVKNEQQIAPFSNPSDKNAEKGLIKSYDQAIPLKATSFHIPITELSKKGKRQESAKDTFHEICSEDHKKYSIYQQSNSSKQSVQSCAKQHRALELIPTDSVLFLNSDKTGNDNHHTMLPVMKAELKKKKIESPVLENLGDKALLTTVIEQLSKTKFQNVSSFSKEKIKGDHFLEKFEFNVGNKSLQAGYDQLLKYRILNSYPIVESNKRKHRDSTNTLDVALTAKRSSHQKKDSAVRNKNIRNQSHSQKVPELEQKYRYRFTASELGLKGLNEIKHVTDSAEQIAISKIASMQANSYRLSSAQTSTEISELFNNKKEDGRNMQLPSAKNTCVLTDSNTPGYTDRTSNSTGDCRMFLYVPVYKEGYIHRTKSAKDTCVLTDSNSPGYTDRTLNSTGDCRMFLYVPVYKEGYIHRTKSAKDTCVLTDSTSTGYKL